jgi:hypothetical protein
MRNLQCKMYTHAISDTTGDATKVCAYVFQARVRHNDAVSGDLPGPSPAPRAARARLGQRHGLLASCHEFRQDFLL